jgi:hypothetical protein
MKQEKSEFDSTVTEIKTNETNPVVYGEITASND